MLASRGLAVKRAVIGSGFCVPPDVSPLPNLRPWKQADPAILYVDEQNLLERSNSVLEALSVPRLERITQLYSDVDETFLVSFEELDHYQERKGGRYWGAWTDAAGKSPRWPAGWGPKVYAYLKTFPALPSLLRALNRLGLPTIVVADGISPELQRKFASTTLRFETQRLNIAQVGRECDLAILNANHGTTVAMLMVGKPVLLVPIYLEQAMLARALVRRLGAAVAAASNNPQQIVERLEAMLQSDCFAQRAKRFAVRYTSFDPFLMKEQMLQHLEKLLATQSG